ncbi:MAG TPA: signal peptide peptidase SppA [Bacteroidales bacterium]|nr:signal peptide peptidase SppA [Bacteroidales bacterium]
MKRFFKYLFVTASGTFLGLALFVLIIFIVIAGIITSSNTTDIEIKDKSVLLIRLHEPIQELSETNPFQGISPLSDNSSILGIHDILLAIKHAKTDTQISGIVLHTDIIQAGYTTLNEIRKALLDFKTSGKFIYAYSDMYTQKSYLLASVADSIFINPQGMFELSGISSQFVSFKNLLDKIGVEPVVFKVGKYKSYVESFTSNTMSAENREQIQALVSNLWKKYTESIQTQRSHIKKPLSIIADSLLVWNAENSYALGLTDSLLYYNDFITTLKKRIAIEQKDDISFVTLDSYIPMCREIEKTNNQNKNTIALIVGSGTIQSGKGDNTGIYSESFCELIRNARKDSTVKAIILRINSGGGSALASESIWHEVSLAAQAKPTIVSMGDVAASGGYYIACPAHVIVAESTTITGSIGVFGMLFNTQELFNKIGVSIDTVNSSSYADLGSPARKVSSYEYAVISKNIENTYTTFKERVAQGRKLSVQQVETIAQGRVWSGTDALKIGLIDTIGGVNTAIAIADKKAQLGGNYNLQIYPEQKSAIEIILDKISGQQSLSKEIEALFGKEIAQISTLTKEIPKQQGIYMQLPYILKIN